VGQNQPIKLLFATLILLFTGCATSTYDLTSTYEEITQDTIQSTLADPARTLPLEVGDTIVVLTV